MQAAPFLLAVILVWPQETDETKRAIAIVKTVNGQLEFDSKAPGWPVIGLNL
jgi:hypothetical protein